MKKRTKKQKQKLLFNILMVCTIVICIVAGALFTAFQKGWLKKSDLQNGNNDTTYHSITLTTIRGEVSILRNGISFYPENDDSIMVNDIVRSLKQSTCEVKFDNCSLYLDEKTELEFSNINRGNMTINVLAGSIIADINSNEEITLNANDNHLAITNGYFSLNANGEYSEEFSVSSKAEKDTGKKATDSDNKKDKPNKDATSKDNREKGGKKGKPNKKKNQTGKSGKDSNNKNNNKDKDQGNNNSNDELQTGNNDKTDNPAPERGESSDNGDAGDNGGNNNHPATEEKPTPSPSPKNVCTISIYCNAILDNMSDLAKGKDKYVPANGCILPKTQITFEEGETAFDILKRACEKNNIPLEYSWTPGVNSYYIEGINHLYEFDCGDTSGWLYDVNGKRPIRGCSYYTVNSGDDFLWHYTCSLGS